MRVRKGRLQTLLDIPDMDLPFGVSPVEHSPTETPRHADAGDGTRAAEAAVSEPSPLAETPQAAPAEEQPTPGENQPSPAEDKSATTDVPSPIQNEPNPIPEHHADRSGSGVTGQNGPASVTSAKYAPANALLLILTLIVLAAWFQWHLQTTLARIGGGASLLLLLGTVWAIIKGLAPAMADWKAVLAQRSTTFVVAGGLVLALVLALGTASIYVEFAGAPKDVEELELRIIDPPTFYAPPLRVYGDVGKVAGRLFFPVWTRSPVKLQIVKPSGWTVKEFSFPFSRALYVRAPRQFEPKAYHLVRILPGPGINLPRPWNGIRKPFTLTVHADRRTYRALDFRARPLLLGTSAPEIEDVEKRSNKIDPDIPIALQRWPDLLQREQDEYRVAWSTSPDILATHDLARGARVAVEVVDDLGARVCSGSFRLAQPTLETLIMEGTAHGKCTFSTMAGNPRS